MATETKTRQMTFTVLDTGDVRADFGEGIEPLTFNPAALPESLFPAALAKGFIMRLQGYTSRLSGEDRTPAKLRESVSKGLDDLKAGIWAAERTPGASAEISIEAEAAHLFRVKRAASKGEVYSLTLEQSAEDFAALPDDKKAQVKELPRFKACYAEVKAARQAAKAAKLAKKADSGDDESMF